jgi:hypothetical protein
MHKSKFFSFTLSLKNFFLLIFLIISFQTFFIQNISAQTAADVNFVINPDKTSINPGDSFNLVYLIANNSATNTIYNIKVDFKYLDQLDNTSFVGSSTGISMASLQADGYKLTSLDPQKTFSITLNFKTNSAIESGKKVLNKLDNSNNALSTMAFTFTQNDPAAPQFTKDAFAVLPDIAAPKPKISEIKYPSGISGYDLSSIDANNVKNVKDFYLQGKNKITFLEDIDLSSDEAINILKNLNNTFDLQTEGSVKISPNNVFNKKMRIEVNNLSFLETPVLFLDNNRYSKVVTYDKTSQVSKFEVDGVGMYTVLGEVKTQIPEVLNTNTIDITGVMTEPSFQLDIDYGEKKQTSILVDLGNGNFHTSYTFTSSGPQTITFIVNGKNGVQNKQVFRTNVVGTNLPSPTVVPVENTTPQKTLNDKSVFDILKYIMLAIGIFALIMILVLFYLSFRKRKINEIQRGVNFKREDLVVRNSLDEKINRDLVSDSRHEVIKAKLQLKFPELEDKLKAQEGNLDETDEF